MRILRSRNQHEYRSRRARAKRAHPCRYEHGRNSRAGNLLYPISLWTFLVLLFLLYNSLFLLGLKKKNKAIQTLSRPNKNHRLFWHCYTDASVTRISHAHICGGQGRFTCRVRIDMGLQHINPPTDRELRAGKNWRPPNVRLACQSFPQGPVSVHPSLLRRPTDGFFRKKLSSGEEREVIFCSVISEGLPVSQRKTAYDLAFILNQYFQVMHTVEEHNDT